MAFVYLCIFVILFVAYKVLHLNQTPEKPKIYGRDVRFVDYLLKSCPILSDGYIPTALWGRSGHVQTVVHSVIGRMHVPRSEGERVFVNLDDGALLSFDLYAPYKPHHSGKDLTLAICPGIGNSSDTVYIQAIVHNALRKGYRCAVLNHLGTLSSVPLKTPRIFSYGGTADLETMVKEVLKRHAETKVVCLGFSMGGNIITRFLASPFFDAESKPKKREENGGPSFKAAEKCEAVIVDIRASGDATFPCVQQENSAVDGDVESDAVEDVVDPRRVVAGISICQGYEAVTTAKLLLQWENLRRLYVFFMTGGMKSLLHRHKSVLLTDEVKERHKLNEAQIFAATTLKEFDEAYTRKVFGYATVDDMYRAMSSYSVLKRIKRPIVFINAADDPIVPEALLEKIRAHVEKADNCMYVETLHGGHLAFFEGGVFVPRKHGWLDRVALQLSDSLVAYADSPVLPPVTSASVPLPSPAPSPSSSLLRRRRRRSRPGAREEEERDGGGASIGDDVPVAASATGVVAVVGGGAEIDDDEEEDEDDVVVRVPQRRPPALSLKQLSSLAC